MKTIDDTMSLIEVLKKYRFFHGSLRKSLAEGLKSKYLSEGQPAWIYDDRNINSSTHPGLMIGGFKNKNYMRPDTVYETRITKEVAAQLDQNKIVMDPDGYGDVYHPYVSAMDNLRLNPVCSVCRYPYEKSLENHDPEHGDYGECIKCGHIFGVNEQRAEIAECRGDK